MSSAADGLRCKAIGQTIIVTGKPNDSTGALVTSDTTDVYLYEMQDDGLLLSYDFDDDTFKSGVLTDETDLATHQKGNNDTTDTGVWSWSLSTLTGLTEGARYIVQFDNINFAEEKPSVEFEYGGLTERTLVDVEATLTTIKGTGFTDTDTLEAIRNALDTNFGGAGATEITLTITFDDDSPIADADVWITADLAGDTIVAGTKQTNSSGEVIFYLDTGVTYYRWVQKDGYTFNNPKTFTPS